MRITLNLFIGVYVARYLGPERFGLLSYAVSFVGLFSGIATLGLDEIVIRNLVRRPQDREKLLGTAFVLRLVGAILLFVFVLAATQMTSSDRPTEILLSVIAGGMIFQSFYVIDFFFKSQVQAKFTSSAQVFSLFVVSVAKVVLIVLGASLVCFAWVLVFENAVIAASLAFVYRKRGLPILQWKFSTSTSVDLMRDAWPLMFSSMAIMVYMRIDQVMIKDMLDSSSVGNYAAAIYFSEVWYFVPMAVSASLFPAIINGREISKKLYYQRLQRLYDFMVWVAIAIAILTTLLADRSILLFLGNRFEQTASVLKIHIWAGVFVFLGVSSGKWFLTENLTRSLFYRTLSGAILNVLLNFLLIPRYGITGAAYATCAAQFCAAYLYDLVDSRTQVTFIMKTKAFFPVHLFR
jgi:O-antigen/teichoic acid export membrane protein